MIILTLIFIILISVFPMEVSQSVAESLDVCINKVIPSLFPFLISSNILSLLNFNIKNPAFNFLSKALNISESSLCAYILGIICGYPIGGKMVLELFSKGELSDSEKDRLLVFANNPGPGFIIGMVGGVFLKSLRAGAIIYLSQILASLTFGILTSFFSVRSYRINTKIKVSPPFLKILSESIKKGMESVISITGVICFFSSVISLINLIPFISSFRYKGLLFGLFEMTNGIREAALIPVSFKLKSALCSFIPAFSGFSVFMQLKVFCEKIKAAPYFLGKMLCGIFAFIYAYILI